MSVKVEVSAAKFQQAQNLLSHIPGAVPRALARAINRSITAANKEATKQLYDHYVVRNKKIITGAKVIKKKASKGSLSASIQVKGAPIPLGAFLTNPKKVPKKRMRDILFAKVKRDGGGQIRGAFIAPVQTGHIGVHHVGVFVRSNGNASLPIKQLYGPSMPQMFGNEEIVALVESRAKVVLDERIDHEIDVILRGVAR